MISKVCKIGQVLERKFITFLEPINGKVYRRLYKNYLRKIGVDINIGGGT